MSEFQGDVPEEPRRLSLRELLRAVEAGGLCGRYNWPLATCVVVNGRPLEAAEALKELPAKMLDLPLPPPVQPVVLVSAPARTSLLSRIFERL